MKKRLIPTAILAFIGFWAIVAGATLMYTNTKVGILGGAIILVCGMLLSVYTILAAQQKAKELDQRQSPQNGTSRPSPHSGFTGGS